MRIRNRKINEKLAADIDLLLGSLELIVGVIYTGIGFYEAIIGDVLTNMEVFLLIGLGLALLMQGAYTLSKNRLAQKEVTKLGSISPFVILPMVVIMLAGPGILATVYGGSTESCLAAAAIAIGLNILFFYNIHKYNLMIAQKKY